MKRNAIILLFITCLAGCSDRIQPLAPELHVDAPDASEAPVTMATDRGGEPDVQTVVQDPSASQDPLEIPSSSAAFPAIGRSHANERAMLQHALYLETRASFLDAITVLREITPPSRIEGMDTTVAGVIRRLRRHALNAPQIESVLTRLAMHTSHERAIAHERLLALDETTVLILRREVRENDCDDKARQSLNLLIDLFPESVPGAAAERLVRYPDSGLRNACIEYVAAHVSYLDANGLRAIMLAAASLPSSTGDHARIRETAARAAISVHPSEIRAMAEALHLFDIVPEPAIAALFALGGVYHFRTDRSDTAMQDLIDGSGFSLADIRSLAARVVSDTTSGEDDLLARYTAWLLEPLDVPAIDSGMAGRWTFPTDRWPMRAADVATHLEVDSVSVSGADTGDVLRKSYSFAVWLKPSELPTGASPTPFSCVMRNEAWSMGLLLDAAGIVYFMHCMPGSDILTHCRSPEPVNLNTWVHVVVTRDLESGCMRLYLNGDAVSVVNVDPPDRELSDDADDTRPFRLLGLPHDEEPDVSGARFMGEADDLRLYHRALPPATVHALFRLGRVFPVAQDATGL